MSSIVSLRGASLRALRSTSTATIAAASKCTAFSHPVNIQQQYSLSTLGLSPTRSIANENKTFNQRVRSPERE